MSVSPVFRFAPSPNGYLHLGHALSALTCQRRARAAHGRLLLRIEDIDLGRCRNAFVDAIIEDLTWLGVFFDGPVLRQSTRLDVHAEAAGELERMGLLYPCFASRREIAEAHDGAGLGRDPDGAPLYPGLHKGLSAADRERFIAQGCRPAMRIDMEAALDLLEAGTGARTLTFLEEDEAGRRRVVADPARWGDAVIARKDVPSSYHLSVVVDDAFQQVSHVVRGRDLFAATDLQRLLQWLLHLPEPIYHHHRLILGDDGQKLSKSEGATALRALREAGLTPDAVRGLIGM